MKYVPLLVVACVVALLVACKNGDGVDITPGATVSPAPGEESPTPTAAPDVCQPNPDPATADDQVIDEPGADHIVTSPVTISGQVRAFEATYQIGIFDADGDVIVETFGTAGPAEVGELAPFPIDVPFSVTEETPACIWVYEQSARDGSPIHVGQIPVTLSP